MDHDHYTAALNDLDLELGRHGTSEDAKLRKIMVFCSTSLALHEDRTDIEREWINQRLHAVAKKHSLPDECVLNYPGK